MKNKPAIPLLEPKARHAWIGVSIAFAALLIGAALMIPFTFESPSLFYKFGFDKFLLRTGKMIGLTAAVLVFLQLPLAGRFKPLDRIFFLPVLYRIHRIDAYVIGLLVLLHPVCIFAPDDMYMIPFEARYWPEWVGAALLVLILCQVVVSRFRRSFGIPYHQWVWGHRLVALLILTALVVHVLNVSETFEQSGIPRTAVWLMVGAWGLVWLWVRIQSYRGKWRPYSVKRISPAGRNAYAVDLEPVVSRPFQYAPGQFAFFSFAAAGLSGEVHPFTLSSTPTRPEALQVTIRRCGDWTDRIDNLKKGDKAFVRGPFGGFTHFTHLLDDDDRQIVMIAGGIGITPMLSMLRCSSDLGRVHPVTLIWSNRSEAYLFHRRELEKIQQHLPRFDWHAVFTREKAGFGRFGRLDRNALEEILRDIRRDALVFICGPPVMIREVRTTLRNVGFAAGSIKWEAFGF